MPVCTLARARRQFILVLVALLLMVLGYRTAHAQAATGTAKTNSATYVEFLIGDRTEETRKWGHVSLKVVGPGVEKIFDFGRYGKMWGRKDSAEGEPILRVWNPGQFEAYRRHHFKDGGTTRRYRFPSNDQRNSRILAYFNKMTNGARRVGANPQFTAYYANYPTFHAVKVNCTTVTIDAFYQGFPEYNLHDMHFATARDLQFYMRGEAQGFNYDQGERRWTRVWWPLDLMAELEEMYVAKGRAQVFPL